VSDVNSAAKPGRSGRGENALSDTRRSPRVNVRVSLVIHYSANGIPEVWPAYTVSVNAHGAMICAAKNLPAKTRFETEHKMTGERQTVRVTRQPQSSPEGFLIPIEFETPPTDFWHISFPPSNWKPLDV